VPWVALFYVLLDHAGRFDRTGETGEIEGTVTLDGTPLPDGMVVIHLSKRWTNDDNVVATSTKIQPDGSFYLVGIPRGPARFCVMSLPPPRRQVRVPGRFKTPETSGIGMNVEGGRQQFDLALTSD
jgi:hypothetical protein